MLKAASEGDEARILAAFEEGEDPNAHSEDGWTPLIMAAKVSSLMVSVPMEGVSNKCRPR